MPNTFKPRQNRSKSRNSTPNKPTRSLSSQKSIPNLTKPIKPLPLNLSKTINSIPKLSLNTPAPTLTKTTTKTSKSYMNPTKSFTSKHKPHQNHITASTSTPQSRSLSQSRQQQSFNQNQNLKSNKETTFTTANTNSNKNMFRALRKPNFENIWRPKLRSK